VVIKIGTSFEYAVHENHSVVVSGVPGVESVTLTGKPKLLGPGGTADSTPEGDNCSQGPAKPPASKDHVYGGSPPVAVSVWLYDCPCIAGGNMPPVVICRGAPAVAVSAKVFIAVSEVPGLLSVTLTMMLNWLGPVGVPDNTPVGDNVSQAGGLLFGVSKKDHVYGGVPPVAVSVWLYECHSIAWGNGLVVGMTSVCTSGSVTGSEKVFVAVSGVPGVVSVTLTRTPDWLGPVGVPDNTPVGDNVSQLGGVPAKDHIYGGVPPIAASVRLYACPCFAGGNVGAVRIWRRATVSAKVFVAVSGVPGVASVTVTVTGVLKVDPGVPDNTPGGDNASQPGG
jgi:hypothetical protein